MNWLPKRALPTRYEHLADAVVHVVGIVLAINASLWLLANVTGLSVLVSVSVYCLGLLAMVGFSAAYNMMPHHRPSKAVLRRLDHAAIFIMIAATYTPFAVNRLGAPYGTLILAVIWASATLGVVMKLIFPRRFETVSIALYLVMGWLVVTVIKPLSISVSSADLWLLGAGGLVYSVGVIFYAIDRIPFNRAIWHTCVFTAAALQFASIWREFVR
jgi:hemolysin III